MSTSTPAQDKALYTAAIQRLTKELQDYREALAGATWRLARLRQRQQRATREKRWHLALAWRSEGKTFKEIGRRFNVGPQRALQIYHQAKRRLADHSLEDADSQAQARSAVAFGVAAGLVTGSKPPAI